MVVQQYETLLNNIRNVQVVAVSTSIAQAASRIRAAYNLRTPDAIQIATAIEQGASFFITNDPIFKRVPGISIIVLDMLLPPVSRPSSTEHGQRSAAQNAAGDDMTPGGLLSI